MTHPFDNTCRQDIQQQRVRLRLLGLQFDRERLLAVTQLFSFQRCIDTRGKQHRIKRFRNIVFGSRLDAAYDAVDLVECRDHNDRDMLDSRIILQSEQYFETIHIRHHQVQQDQVEISFGQKFQGSVTTICHAH